MGFLDDGFNVGFLDGFLVGFFVGTFDGTFVGVLVGGFVVGVLVDGIVVGVGKVVGDMVLLAVAFVKSLKAKYGNGGFVLASLFLNIGFAPTVLMTRRNRHNAIVELCLL